MRVLVTGASGFVGRQAVSALLALGVEVHAAARKPLALDCTWHVGDLLDPGFAQRLAREVKPDVVLHLAWCVEHGKFWTDSANTDWVAASLILAREAAGVGCARFVGTGTCFEYDWPSEGDCGERTTPLAGHTLYDISKTSCRSALEAQLGERGVSFAWARLFFPYGAGEDPRRLVSSVARALVRGEPAECSRGLAVRDFVEVRDVGAALAAIALSSVTGGINIASGQGTRIAEVATMLGELAGRPDLIRLGALPDRADDPPRIVADVARLTGEVGFQSRFDLRSGLRDALAFWQATPA